MGLSADVKLSGWHVWYEPLLILERLGVLIIIVGRQRWQTWGTVAHIYKD